MSKNIKAKIVIVDDNAGKVEDIQKVWVNAKGPEWSELLVMRTVSTALRYLRTQAVDLLILDLMIPLRDNGIPDREEARRMLEELHDDTDVLPPREVIVLSEYSDVLDAERKYYLRKGWTSLLYGYDLEEWQSVLGAKFGYISNLVASAAESGGDDYNVDYCIISALRSPELDPVLRWACEWKSTARLDSTEFHTGRIAVRGIERTIVCGNAFRMGMVHSSLLCAKAWHYFRPRFVLMVGIAAGVRKICNFGDILIAEEVWDYGAGKISENRDGEQIFLPDPRHVNAEASIVESLWNFGKTDRLLENIEKAWPSKRPKTHLNILKGPMASGAAVIANRESVEHVLLRNRKLIGLEMEAYGVYCACEYLPRPRPRYVCVKSVCDFADAEKGDDFQDYASFTSSEFIYRVLRDGVLEDC